MKILHIFGEINYSGAETMLARASDEYKKYGVELYALSTGEKPGSFSDVMTGLGIQVLHLPFSKSFDFFIELFGLIKTNKFDVIHIHMEKASVWVSLLAKFAGVKSIVRTYHSSFDFSGMLRLRRIITRFIMRLVGVKGIAIGDSVQMVESRILYNPTKKIYNWVDEKIFYPAQSADERNKIRNLLSIRSDDFVVITIGACSMVKQHEDVLMALMKLKESGFSVKYIHVGDGENNLQERRITERNGMQRDVSFVGQVSNVRDFLIASDVLLSTSKYEGLSIAQLEAMKCGIPVIAYDTLGQRDLIQLKKNGFLIKSGNTEELQHILEKIILKKIQLPSINQVIASVDHINMQRSVREIIHLYKS